MERISTDLQSLTVKDWAQARNGCAQADVRARPAMQFSCRYR
jgi:hypothetical protein